MATEFEGKFLGVLAGMGPLAGASFLSRLTLLTDASIDQEHIPAILWSDPRVPSRPAAYQDNGADPLPWMLNGIHQLQKVGAKAIAIPCNTAHLWHSKLQEQTELPILHIVDAVIENLKQQGVASGAIGLLGTTATLQAKIYQNRLESHGFTCVVPTAEEIPRFCTHPIELVKNNQIELAYAALTPSVNAMLERDVKAIILGCTELPLALPHAKRHSFAVPIVDSIDALALASIKWYQSGPN